MDRPDSPTPPRDPSADRPAPGEPGWDSTPAADGDDVVELEDRVDGGAPAANQSKVEPVRPGASEDVPDPST